ncbi:MAG: tetratricopeptide repeat protein [Planctomycetaceae bacterium]
MTDAVPREPMLDEAKKLVRAGELSQAIDLFKKILETDNRHMAAHEGLAAAYYMQKSYADAATHFQKVAMLDPRKGTALINLGAIYNRMGDFQQAVIALRKGLAKEKKSAEGYYNLGIAHKGLNQLSMAVSAYREALRLDSEMAEAYQNLANVYLEMGNHAAAIANYHRALEIRPDFERAKRGLEKVQQMNVKAKETANPFGRLVGEGPSMQRSSRKLDRELSDEERFRDRMALNEITTEIILETGKWREQIQQEIESSLGGLHRVITQDDPPPFVLNKMHASLQQSLDNFQVMRKGVKRKLLELRAHEELILASTLIPPA